MLLKQTPRPKNGINVKVLSKSYTIHFKNDADWEYFKRTLIKVIDLKYDKGNKSVDISKAELVK